MRFSLIVATAGRSAEVHALLTSLATQSFREMEVIIVDQNPDQRLATVTAAFVDRLKIHHLHTTRQALSSARNLGLHVASGQILGFPDDDCIYPPGTLDHLNHRFASDAGLAALAGAAITKEGQVVSTRSHHEARLITKETVWTSVISFAFFIRADIMHRVGLFDEDLGIGARFGAAEETDLALRVVGAGAKFLFDPTVKIVHPDKRLTESTYSRASNYGRGLGRVLRKHRTSPSIVLTSLIRPLGGIGWAFLNLNPRLALYYWRSFCGRLAGYLAQPTGLESVVQPDAD